MNTTTNATETETAINIVRLSLGAAFRRYEIAEGCWFVIRHGSDRAPTTMDLDEAREEIAEHVAAGWQAATV